MRKSETPITATLRLKTITLPSGLTAIVYPGAGTAVLQFVADIRDQLNLDLLAVRDGDDAQKLNEGSQLARMNRLYQAATFGYSVKALNFEGDSYVFDTPRVSPSGSSPEDVIAYARAVLTEIETGIGAELIDFADVAHLADRALKGDVTTAMESEKKDS